MSSSSSRPTSPSSAAGPSSSSQQQKLPAIPWHIFSVDLQTLKDEANRRRTTSLADSCSAATMSIQANTSATQTGDIHKALKAETDAAEALWQVFTVAADTLRGSKFSSVGIAGLGKLAAANLMLPNQVSVTCSMLKKMFWNASLFSASSSTSSSSSSNSNSDSSSNSSADEDVHMRVAQTLCSMLCSDSAREVGIEFPLSVALALYCSTPFPHVQAAAGAAVLQVTSPLLDLLVPPNYYHQNQNQNNNNNNNNNNKLETVNQSQQQQQEPHLVDGPIQKQHMSAVYLFRDCIILAGWSTNNPAIQQPMWLQGLTLNNSSPAAFRAKQTISTLCLDILLSFFSSRDAAVVNQLMNLNSSSSSSDSSSSSKIGAVTKKRLPHVAKVVNEIFVPVFCASVFSSSQEVFSRFHRLVVAVVGQLWPLFDKKPFHTLLEKNVQLILGGGGPVSMTTSSSSSSSSSSLSVSVPSTEVSWRVMSIVSQWRRVVSLVGLLPRLVQKEFYEFNVTDGGDESGSSSINNNNNNSNREKKGEGSSSSSSYDWQVNPLIRLLLAPARVLEAMVSSSSSKTPNSKVIWAPELVGVLVDFTTSLCQALARWFCSSPNLGELSSSLNDNNNNNMRQTKFNGNDNNNNNNNSHLRRPSTSGALIDETESSSKNQSNNNNSSHLPSYISKEIPTRVSHDIFDVIFSQLYCCFALAISRLSGEDVLHSALKALNHLVTCACVVRHAPARDAFLLLLSNELRDDNSSSTKNNDDNNNNSSSNSNHHHSNARARANSQISHHQQQSAPSSSSSNVLTERKIHILNTVVSIANGLGNDLGHAWRIIIRCFLLVWDLKTASEKLISSSSSSSSKNNNSNNNLRRSQPSLDDIVQTYNLPSDAVLDEQELSSVSFAIEHVFESTSSCFSNDTVLTLAHFLAQIPSDAEDDRGRRILPRDPLDNNNSQKQQRSSNNNIDSPVLSEDDDAYDSSENIVTTSPSSKKSNSNSSSGKYSSFMNNNSLPSDITSESVEFISSMLLALLKSAVSTPIIHRNSITSSKRRGEDSNSGDNKFFNNESRFVKCYWPATKSFMIAVCKASSLTSSATQKTAIKFCSDVIALLNQQMSTAMDGKLDFFLYPASVTKTSESKQAFILTQIQEQSNDSSFSAFSPSSSSSPNNNNNNNGMSLEHTFIQQKFSTLMSLPIQVLLELFQRSDSIFSTNNECPPPEARRLIANEALLVVQQYGSVIIGDSWQHLCRIAELSASTNHVGNDGDVLTTAFRIVELIHHGCIVQLGQLGLIKFIACVGSFIRQTVSDHNLSVNLSAVHIAWSVADYIVSGENEESASSPIRSNSLNSPTKNNNSTSVATPKNFAGQQQHQDPNSISEDDQAERLLASTPKRQVTWSSLQWDALLIQLRDGGCDPRPEIRQSALRSLFAVVSTHGSSMPPEVWSTCVWEVLLHVVERFESDIVSPLRNYGMLSEENARSKMNRKNNNNNNNDDSSSANSQRNSSGGGQQPSSTPSYEVLSSRRPQWLEVYVSLLEGLPRVVMKFVDFISRHASNSHKVFGRLISFGANALLAIASEHVSLAAARLLGWLLSELAPCPSLLDNNDFDSLLLTLNEVGQRCQSEGQFILNVLKTIIDCFPTTLRNLCAFSSSTHQMQVPVRLYGPLNIRSSRTQHAIERFISFVEMALDSEAIQTTFMFPASVQTSALDFADALGRMLCNNHVENNNNNNSATLPQLLSHHHGSSNKNKSNTSNTHNNKSSSVSSSTSTSTSLSSPPLSSSAGVASVWLSLHRLFLSRVPSAEKVIEILEACKSIMSKHMKENSINPSSVLFHHQNSNHASSDSSASASSSPAIFKNMSSFTTSQSLNKFIDRGCQPAFVATALKWLANTWPLINHENFIGHNNDQSNSFVAISHQLLPELLYIATNAIPLSCLPQEQFASWNAIGVAATTVYITASGLSIPRMTKPCSSSVSTSASNNNNSNNAGLSILEDVLLIGSDSSSSSNINNPSSKDTNNSGNNNNNNKNSPVQNNNNSPLSPGRGAATAGPLSYYSQQQEQTDENHNSSSFQIYNLSSPSSFSSSRHGTIIKVCTSTLVDLLINKNFETLKDLDSLCFSGASNNNNTTTTTSAQQQQQQPSFASPFSNNKTTWQLLEFAGKVFRAFCFISQNDHNNHSQKSTSSSSSSDSNKHLIETSVSTLLEVFVSIANQENEDTNANSEKTKQQSASPASPFQLELVEAASAKLISAWGLLDTLMGSSSSSTTNNTNSKLDPSVVEEKVVKRTLNLIQTYIEKIGTQQQQQPQKSMKSSSSSSSVLVKRIVSSLSAFNQGSGVDPSNYSEARKRLLRKIAQAALPLVSCAKDDEVRVAVQNLFGLILEL